MDEEPTDYPPLHGAADRGEQQAVEALLRAGADPNELDRDGMTALEYSTYRGDEAITRTLLTFGANPNLPSRNPPLEWAIQQGHLEVARLLIDNKADVNTYQDGPSVLQNAAGDGNLAAVRLLLNAGANVNLDVDGTALHTACAYGHLLVVQELLAQGAFANARNQEGQTPLFFALSAESPAIIDLLMAYGAIVEVVDYKGRTPEAFVIYLEEENERLAEEDHQQVASVSDVQ